MTKYLIDTDILIDYFNEKEPSTSFVQRLIDGVAVVISIISVAEIRAGWNEKQAQKYMPMLYTLFSVKPLTTDVAELAGKFKKDYSEKGTTLGLDDMLIAATAINSEYTFVTRNVRHFPMPELDLYQGLQSSNLRLLMVTSRMFLEMLKRE